MSIPPVYTQRPDQLVSALQSAGWSQEDIAAAVGVSQPTICRILNGQHRDPRYSVVQRLRQLVLELTDLTEG